MANRAFRGASWRTRTSLTDTCRHVQPSRSLRPAPAGHRDAPTRVTSVIPRPDGELRPRTGLPDVELLIDVAAAEGAGLDAAIVVSRAEGSVADVRQDEFDEARRETVRYHQAVYADGGAGALPGWWARPHRLVLDGREHVDGPVHVYDLGAGTGRHALWLAEHLPPDCRVTAVDLLPEALDQVSASATQAGTADRIDTVVADVEDYEFPHTDAGFVVAFSVLEHLSSPAAVSALLARCRAATRPGGIHVIAVFADRQEITGHGVRRAPVECPLTAQQARSLLRAAYRDWDILQENCSDSAVPETRHGQKYQLRSTLVALIARSPSRATATDH